MGSRPAPAVLRRGPSDGRRRGPVRYPATLAIVALVLAAGFYTRGMGTAEHTRLLERIGSDVDDWDARRLLAMPLATLVQSAPGVGWDMVLMVALPLALLERRVGSLRAAATFALCDWVSTPLNLLAIWTLARLGSGEARAFLDTADAGSSAAAHGTIAAVAVLLPGRWRWAALAGAYGFVTGALLLGFQDLDAALVHAIATVIGTALGLLWRQRGTAWPRGVKRAATGHVPEARRSVTSRSR